MTVWVKHLQTQLLVKSDAENVPDQSAQHFLNKSSI